MGRSCAVFWSPNCSFILEWYDITMVCVGRADEQRDWICVRSLTKSLVYFFHLHCSCNFMEFLMVAFSEQMKFPWTFPISNFWQISYHPMRLNSIYIKQLLLNINSALANYLTVISIHCFCSYGYHYVKKYYGNPRGFPGFPFTNMV